MLRSVFSRVPWGGLTSNDIPVSKLATYAVIPDDDPTTPLVFPESPAPEVSIVIPVYNAWAHTHLCLRAILQHTKSPSYEVILADDASTDETTTASLSLKNVVVIRDDTRRGYVLRCNEAARMARGRYLVLLNNDTVVQPGWLGALARGADGRHDVGIVGGKVLAADGSLQEAGCLVLADATPVRRGIGGNPADRAYAEATEVDYVSGCCLLIRRELWQQLGGFDERFAPAYYEDVDLAFAARLYGYRTMYEPRAVVLHVGGVTYGRERTGGTKELVSVNAQKFLSKWPDVTRGRSSDTRAAS